MPLRVSLVDVYREICHTKKLPPPHPIKHKKAGSQTEYCEYHKLYGHFTNECYDLKNVIKKLPREYQLDRYLADRLYLSTLMNKVFSSHIGKLMEVYVDDMLVKTKEDGTLLSDLSEVFSIIRKHEMRLNPSKCTFTVKAGKFLGFMLTQKGRGKSRTYGGKGLDRGKIVCTYCGKLGHTIDVYYRKHGLPPHLKERYNSGSATTFNYAAIDDNVDEASADQKQQMSDEQCLKFTQDQKIALLALLQRNKLQLIHNTNQIVGQTPAMRGATDHVSYYLKDFDTYHHIPTIIVKLPNGSYTIGTDSSKMRIGVARATDRLYALDISTQHAFSSSSSTNSVISFNSTAFTHI
ncbi:uncharacterized protein LOC130945521 [Arachis stenosperma]|uniref:uncharacterized protein LOC130945521 n=1 Tax=Arachis stenosperma TaxID=217475 RepID=UPI0025AD0E5F|nr:uncharacterized protein LOC130945521 [Arachis stenosperma]